MVLVTNGCTWRWRGDGDDDAYCASVEKRHFCFETNTISPCINFKLLICVAEIAMTYYLTLVQGVSSRLDKQ